MSFEPLPHSRALRVVGQRLHGTGIDAFELNKNGAEYIARVNCSITQNIFGDRGRAVPLCFRFTNPEIVRYDNEEKLRRRKTNALPNIDHLAVVLRVLGDYLDRNGADDFAVFWSRYSVTIHYVNKDRIFTAQNLYDLGIAMYLRSSNHAPGDLYPRGAEMEQRRIYILAPAASPELEVRQRPSSLPTSTD